MIYSTKAARLDHFASRPFNLITVPNSRRHSLLPRGQVGGGKDGEVARELHEGDSIQKVAIAGQINPHGRPFPLLSLLPLLLLQRESPSGET